MLSEDCLVHCTEVLHVERLPVGWSGQMLIQVGYLKACQSKQENRQISIW